ncbi:MAG: hypothetical protein KatS3mg003_1182 [Candidatus Nitrosocaldaceae archaeon]|nr:MAG: hypothetical protein KatS3mg003_1182 [Candidatus Nitrosocaldaceae archaeon]
MKYIILSLLLIPIYAYAQDTTINYNGYEFVLSSSLSNGDIVSMELKPELTSLIINVDMDDDGILEISIPREMLDSKKRLGMSSEDNEFIVLIDGDYAIFEEIGNDEINRTLSIKVPSNAEMIEIIGTNAIPEFPLAIIVLVSSITLFLVVRSIYGGKNVIS